MPNRAPDWPNRGTPERSNIRTRERFSTCLKWPDARTVDRAVRQWPERTAREGPEALRIGYFGSYARGDAICLPVPADVLVYTQAEWQRMEQEGRLARAPWREMVWVYSR